MRKESEEQVAEGIHGRYGAGRKEEPDVGKNLFVFEASSFHFYLAQFGKDVVARLPSPPALRHAARGERGYGGRGRRVRQTVNERAERRDKRERAESLDAENPGGHIDGGDAAQQPNGGYGVRPERLPRNAPLRGGEDARRQRRYASYERHAASPSVFSAARADRAGEKERGTGLARRTHSPRERRRAGLLGGGGGRVNALFQIRQSALQIVHSLLQIVHSLLQLRLSLLQFVQSQLDVVEPALDLDCLELQLDDLVA